MSTCQGANLCFLFFREEEPVPESGILGVLAFDTAKTMCRLVSLYKSLTDVEILKLRRHVIRSKGVSYLNSQQECFLLNLACAERLEDLDLAAATMSRLCASCTEAGLKGFDVIYANLKSSNSGLDARKLEYGSKNVEKVIERMERLVSTTRNLHTAMESLSEMEISEKKIQRWRSLRSNHGLMVKVECFDDRIEYHRRQVQHYKQISLWNQTFDKVVSLMSRIICILYARICRVFRSLILAGGRNRRNLENYHCLLIHRDIYMSNVNIYNNMDEQRLRRRKKQQIKNNPCLAFKKISTIKFANRHAPSRSAAENGVGGGGNGKNNSNNNKSFVLAKNNKVLRLAPPTTVGGSGLSQRYANVILFMDRCMHAPVAIGEDARVALYEMLPERLKMKLKAKLRKQWQEWENCEKGTDRHLKVAAKWRDTVEEVMDWLSPLATDTVRWQTERNLEKQRYDMKPTVLLMQTLHYSDLEKVEEAIVDVLVGLSCIYWFQKEWRL
ncbi:hypothetical protein PIB30_068225 [Stylosanthes scabra]|uniref:Avr9/Cf-9 rapidly elicited protein 137 n=1 Tax=Stylosanthes scabra TaxID=79078 RepID=A0ABU6XNJ3_9FABA|nr:hypothetical protein [Stylosanthes scabra]